MAEHALKSARVDSGPSGHRICYAVTASFRRAPPAPTRVQWSRPRTSQERAMGMDSASEVQREPTPQRLASITVA